MKNSFKYIGSALVAGLMLTGCSLEEDNPHAGGTDVTLYNYANWSGLQATCYSALNAQLFNSSDYLFVAEPGTDIWAEQGNGNYAMQLFCYEGLGTDTNNCKSLWKRCYTFISTCNTVINTVDQIPDGEESAKKILVAEAKTLRAYLYSILVANFGPVTLNLESNSSLSGAANLNPVRSSETAIYDQIFQDLNEAIEVLPIQPFENNPARVRRATAKGLLARAYAQRAGLGTQLNLGDAQEYWQLCKKTTEDMLNNMSGEGIDFYNDIADMWADANNRTNKEALFIAYFPSNMDAELVSANNVYNNLACYMAAGRTFDEYFAGYNNFRPDKGQSFMYTRGNNSAIEPSQYLLNCYDPKWDRRWEYTWAYAFSTMTMTGWSVGHNTVSYTITADAAKKYGIDPSHVGEKLQPYAEFLINSSGVGNQYDPQIWAPGVTTDDGATLKIASSAAQCGQNGYANTTKLTAVPWPVSPDDKRFAYVFTHEEPSAADKAKMAYMTININDLYGSNGLPYGNIPNGSEAANPPKVGDGSVSGSVAPWFQKFNQNGLGFYTGNAQRKTGNVFIMRTAELYLLAAEANQMLGDGATAARWLKPLRDRALRKGATAPTISNATEDDIFDEYARELCGEYGRWNLLNRHQAFETRLAKYNTRAAKSFKKHMYNRPISQEFLDVILNAEEYGDNGYGATSASGLAQFGYNN